jgi:hypothetical protein
MALSNRQDGITDCRKLKKARVWTIFQCHNLDIKFHKNPCSRSQVIFGRPLINDSRQTKHACKVFFTNDRAHRTAKQQWNGVLFGAQ